MSTSISQVVGSSAHKNLFVHIMSGDATRARTTANMENDSVKLRATKIHDIEITKTHLLYDILIHPKTTSQAHFMATLKFVQSDCELAHAAY